MQGPALRATGRNNMNKMLAGRWFDGEACNAQKDGNTTLKINGVFFFAERQDVSVQRPERWKHHFLKTAGMCYCAERQEPRAPRKMETPLAEDRWRVLLCRTRKVPSAQQDGKHHLLKTTGVFYCAEREEPQAPSRMETPLFEDHWQVLLGRKTGASSAQKDGNITF